MKQDHDYAKISELNEGDFIQVDGGFRCMGAGDITKLSKDNGGLFFVCDNGKHYISKEIVGDKVLGVYKIGASCEITNPVTSEPILFGEETKAWLTNNAEGRRQMNIQEKDDACIAHWIIEAPWAHPAWHSYSLVAVHLRPMPNGCVTKFFLPMATHELWLFALNPESDRNQLIRDGITHDHWLSPINFAAQFTEISDELAVERIRNTVQLICDRKLSPDTDFRADWIKLFGDNMVKNGY